MRAVPLWVATSLALLACMALYWHDALGAMLEERRVPDLLLFLGMSLGSAFVGMLVTRLSMGAASRWANMWSVQLIVSILIATAALVAITSYLTTLMTVT